MKTLLTFSLCATFLPISSLADTYTIESRHTGINFSYSHLGYTTQRGRFNETAGKVAFDPANHRGKAQISVKAGSLSMALPQLEAILKSEEYFDVERYPTIAFESDNLEFSGEQLIAMNGSLTLRGVTKPVRLVVQHFVCKPNPTNKKFACGGDAEAVIKRTDFGMSGFVPLVSDEVRLQIPVFAYRD